VRFFSAPYSKEASKAREFQAYLEQLFQKRLVQLQPLMKHEQQQQQHHKSVPAEKERPYKPVLEEDIILEREILPQKEAAAHKKIQTSQKEVPPTPATPAAATPAATSPAPPVPKRSLLDMTPIK